MASNGVKVVRHYDYQDTTGEVIRQKLRWSDKGFSWQSRIENGWANGYAEEEYPHVLYKLPDVARAVAADKIVWVCEGEKDAEALIKRGWCATTPPQNGQWPPGLADPLRNARVYVCWDKDEDGVKRLWYALRALYAVDADVVVCLRAAVGNDVADHLAAGLSERKLVPETPEEPVPTTTNGKGQAYGARKPTVWPGQQEGRLATAAGDLTKARPFKFAWDNRVLLGYFNLMVGEEGIGKGNLFAWLAAQVTLGTLPGHLGGPRKVLFVGDEDSWENIWVPRLAAAGGDVGMCIYVTQPLDLTVDVPPLEATIRHENIALTYFDQLLDNLGYADSWKDKEVRQALAPLRRCARDTDTAMLASMHPNKKSGVSFREKVSGTPAFNALSRSSLYLAQHPDDESQVAVVRPKGNYNMDPPAWVFGIEGAQVVGAERQTVETSRVVHGHEEPLDKRLVLEGQAAKGERQFQNEVAGEVISGWFKDGVTEVEAADVLEHCKAEGVSESTAQRARRKLGLHTRKNGTGGWHWYKP